MNNNTINKLKKNCCLQKDEDRLYRIDAATLIKLPKRAIDKFVYWNSTILRSNQLTDKKLVRSLLVICGKKTAPANENQLAFIKKFLEVRVDGNNERLDRFDGYVEDLFKH